MSKILPGRGRLERSEYFFLYHSNHVSTIVKLGCFRSRRLAKLDAQRLITKEPDAGVGETLWIIAQ